MTTTEQNQSTPDRTLVLVKPDGVERGLTGEVLERIERKGYRLADIRWVTPTRELLERHYAEHKGKPFFDSLVEFMLSGPIVAVIFAGDNVVPGVRTLLGASDPTVAAPGTIRGDLGRDWGVSVQRNVVHASDSTQSAAREIGIWFA
ncbi:nucleoside-diphosphate kinase [Pseudoclavibacter sp. 13-3]|uniref:nucleoside-diphosphate kinase n=1 Tax=Pseudoclavibacter sp. 13-3 TaxID=2901228 RepID=UPI001E456564|nr:nucleoside-diphosphate kinase [Pseudoclavibacter sp. 13-3]MCD7100801.1 nucleoside-diphosphate kinase [Pseudoclavibacter sp. 13-3]